MVIIMSIQKKKITQDELRRLMNEQKKKLLNNVKKIESPLARYDKDGNLTCIVCDSVVRSEAVWSVHLNTKNHRQNVANMVKRKESPSSSPQEVEATQHHNLKRLAPPPLPVSSKEIKGILKNAPPAPKYAKIIVLEESKGTDKSTESDVLGFNELDSNTETEEEIVSNETLPEGFFDDPKLDAKVRNVEYKDPIEEEWEQFQKEIKEETSKAQQLIAEDQEEATNERQIDEIDEQIRNWSRVVCLEKKKQEVLTLPQGQQHIKEEDLSSGDESEFQEFVDWRSKKSFT